MSLRRTSATHESATRPSAPIWLAALAALAASACATSPSPEPAAPAAAAKPAAPVAAPSPAAAAATPPASFAVCAACHGTKPGAPPSLGPNLFGIAGKKAGVVAGFDYSEAMKASPVIWTPENLAAFVQSPSKVIPNNDMDYPGMSNPADAKAIADYMATLKN